MRSIVSSLSAIRCSSMENKENYQKYFENEVNLLQKAGKKPKLLLHACCGPCFTLPYELIKGNFDVTIIYNNSNIYPEEEYHRRLDELKKYVSEVAPEIKIIEFDYDNVSYNKDLEPYANDREGNERCRICFRKRLTQGFAYAKEHGFEYFGTVMTISRYKNSQDLNHIGFELEKEFAPVKWLAADFKKNDGYNKSLVIVREHKMYFQDYCGCKFSIRHSKPE